MLKANELRVGNFVLHKDYKNFIKFDEANWYRIGECIEFLEDFEPIPLTEDWLVKFFNITRRNGNVWLFDFSENFTCMWDGERILIEEYSEGEYPLNHIKHVHQLQNLYFALTGEELVCK
jgi:hypothetical protein